MRIEKPTDRPDRSARYVFDVGFDPSAIGRRVREERVKAGLSLAQLAATSGLTKAYLVRLETQGGNPSVEVVAQIAEALDLTAADLLEMPIIRYVPDESDVSPSLRAFADEARLSKSDLDMLASIRWRDEKPPQTTERWRYVYRSLLMSREIDTEQDDGKTD